MIVVYILAIIGYFSLGDFLMTKHSNHFTVEFIENISSWYFYIPALIAYLIFWPIPFTIDTIVKMITGSEDDREGSAL